MDILIISNGTHLLSNFQAKELNDWMCCWTCFVTPTVICETIVSQLESLKAVVTLTFTEEVVGVGTAAAVDQV